MARIRCAAILMLTLAAAGSGRGLAADWPMWRHDAARSGASPEALPAELHLAWSRQLPPPQPAWPDEPRLAFDWADEPVAAGGTLFVPSSARDSLTALDIETGAERWRFYAQGPVRFPAAIWEGRVCFVSDDGYLYCLDAPSGRLLWKRRGGPDERKLLGNGRLISAWPARGGPVTAEGKVYFAAGIWPAMGIFVRALDAATGRVLWTNDTSGSQWTEQPHGGSVPNGPAPQGCLVLAGERLLVPCGRTYPAVFDARDGRLLAWQMGSREDVGCQVVAADRYFFAGALCGFGDPSGSAGASPSPIKSGSAGASPSPGGSAGASPSRDRPPYGGFEILRPEGYRLPVIAGGMLFRSTFHPVPLDPGAILYHRPSDPTAGTEAHDLAGGKWTVETRGGRESKTFAFPSLWRLPGFQVAIKAGNRLYGSIGSEVAAVDLATAGGTPRISWRSGILVRSAGFSPSPSPSPSTGRDGVGAAAQPALHPAVDRERKIRPEGRTTNEEHPLSLLAASGKLIVVTAEGGIYCFGGKAPYGGQPVVHELPSLKLETRGRERAAKEMLDAAGPEPGWGLVLGIADGQLVEELLRQSQLRLVAVDADEGKIDALRRRWDAAGEYGRRVAAIAADPRTLPLPPYMARLITSEDINRSGFGSAAEFAGHVFDTLRPFGGVACLPLGPSVRAGPRARPLWEGGQAQGPAPTPPGARVSRNGDLTVLRREGALPGSGNWTHEFADAANTRMGPDGLVRGPFAPLWFGGELANRLLFAKTLVPSAPPIVDGRMFVQGPDAMRAVDIYTGTILWTHRFGDNKESRSLLFERGDWRVTYKPPAGGTRDYSRMKRVGYRCVAVPDAVYLACGTECLRLDPATGKELGRLAAAGDDGRPLYWDSLRVWENVLVATALSPDVPTSGYGFTRDELGALRREFQGTDHYRNLEALPSNYLLALDRQSGKVLWRRKARQAFLGGQCTWHLWGAQSYQDSTVAVGGGKVFCLDMLPPDILAVMKRRGREPSLLPQLAALDVRSGQLVWERPPYGGFASLAYSQEFDVLVEVAAKQMSGRGQGFSGEGIAARKGSDGSLLWKASGLEGPVVLHHRTVHANGPALDLLTGAKTLIKHPLTGEPIPWGYTRGYGCGVPIGGEHLLTFRSGTAAYYDLGADSGTVYLPGMRAGCVNSFIPAGGLLNAPNFAYGCACNFQNDTSLALVTTPDAEAWASIHPPPIAQPVRRLGLNFGAAGSRRAEDGTVWLPCTEGRGSPNGVRVEANPLRPFRWHPSQVDGEGLRWVAASGIDGVRKLSIDLRPADGPPIPYAVAIQFIEPQAAAPGDRVFDVALQGAVVAKDFDIVAQAGAARRAIVRRWSGIPVRRQLEITFLPKAGAKLPYAAVSGVEIQIDRPD